MKINKANDYYIDTQFAKEGDYNGRELVVQITNAGEITSQQGVALNLGWRHNIIGNSGLTPFEEEDISKGIFKLSYPNNMLNTGSVTAFIQIIENGKVINTRDFVIEVENNTLNARAIVLDNSFETLNKALSTVNEYDNKIADLEKRKADKSIVVTQSEFDSWVASILDGGPSIFMNTLNELQTTYPDGAAGVALVRETDPAKIYVWNGSAWEDFGDYQGIEVKDGTITTSKLDAGAVTADKTNFIGTGKNLFNKLTRNIGYVVDRNNGELVVSSGGNSSTDFIPVKPNTSYYKNIVGLRQVVFYDRGKKYISGVGEEEGLENHFVTPDNCYYIKTNLNEDTFNSFQIEEGNEYTGYEEFYYRLDSGETFNNYNRGQLVDTIQVELNQSILTIPANCRVRTAENNYTSSNEEPHVINFSSVATQNKHLFFNTDNNLFFISRIGVQSNPVRVGKNDVFIGSIVFTSSETAKFENFIGTSDEYVHFYKQGKNSFDKSKRNIGQVVNPTTGQLSVSSGGNSSTDFIPVRPNVMYHRSDNHTKQIAYYNINKEFISGGSVENTFTTPSDCYYVRTNFPEAVSNSFQIEEGDSFTGYEPFYRTRIKSEKEIMRDDIENLNQQIVDFGGETSLEVRLSLTEQTSKAYRTNPLMTDIENYYPFNSIKLCNVNKTEWGATNVTYSHEQGFSTDGSNGDVFAEIPKHYFKREIRDGNEYLSISGTQLPGHQIDPAFVENGKVLDKIYVGVYDGYVSDGKLNSWSGVNPHTEYVFSQMQTFAKNKGKGYALLDFRTVAMLQKMFVVYFADRNSEIIGRGMTDFPYQVHASTLALYSESNTNKITVDEVSSNPNKTFRNGMTVMVSSDPKDMVSPLRKVTSLTKDENGRTVMTFDGSPYDVVAGETRIFTRAQKTGLTDNINSHFGQSNFFGGESGHDAVKVFHIENLWGNVWNELDGIALNNLVPYIGENIEDYTSDVSEMKLKYKPLAKKLPLQSSNYQDGGSGEWAYYVKNVMLDPLNPAYQLPYELGGGATKDTHYTDPFYSNDGEFSIPAFGGGFDHMYRAGMFTLRFWYSPTATFPQLNGARIIYKPI
uniref:hypothetical protein n=1 Tax=Aerococcus urinaeequi TaxID=51665 RepID=UPI00352B49BA